MIKFFGLLRYWVDNNLGSDTLIKWCLMAKHLFKCCYSWLCEICRRDGDKPAENSSCSESSTQPGLWALYLTSRQDFVWCCSIIPAHSPVVIGNQAGSLQRTKQEGPFDSVLGCLLWNPTFIPDSRQGPAHSACRADSLRILLSGADKPLNPIVSQHRSCTGAQAWVLGGSLYRFLLCWKRAESSLHLGRSEV